MHVSSRIRLYVLDIYHDRLAEAERARVASPRRRAGDQVVVSRERR